jgi:hypothetical protein
MFKSLFGKKEKPAPPPMPAPIPSVLLQLRETLYTNASLEPFLSRVQGDMSVAPWLHFVTANQALKEGNNTKSIAHLKEIVRTPGYDTRIYLQAWHTLTSLGELPEESLRGRLQGVVIENHMVHGLDIVAAYADHSARYWNYSGTGVVWEARDPEIDKLIDDLFTVGQEISKRIGIGLRDIPAVPNPGCIHIFIMSYDGSTIGTGGFENLSKDPMGNAAIGAGINLMQGLIRKQQEHQKQS